jgi:hypothetical protein
MLLRLSAISELLRYILTMHTHPYSSWLGQGLCVSMVWICLDDLEELIEKLDHNVIYHRAFCVGYTESPCVEVITPQMFRSTDHWCSTQSLDYGVTPNELRILLCIMPSIQ